MSEDRFAASAREYVESLHQNSRTHLLYGKNNVLVQPVRLQHNTITASVCPWTSTKHCLFLSRFVFKISLERSSQLLSSLIWFELFNIKTNESELSEMSLEKQRIVLYTADSGYQTLTASCGIVFCFFLFHSAFTSRTTAEVDGISHSLKRRNTERILNSPSSW